VCRWSQANGDSFNLPHDNIGFGVEELADAVRLQIGAIADTDLSRQDRRSSRSPRFSSVSAKNPKRSLGRSKALECAPLVLPLGESSGFRHGGHIDGTDQSALSRRRCTKC
jgi:hypothetical protein